MSDLNKENGQKWGANCGEKVRPKDGWLAGVSYVYNFAHVTCNHFIYAFFFLLSNLI